MRPIRASIQSPDEAVRVQRPPDPHSPSACRLLPRWVPPWLCQLVEIAPSGPQWLHEIKLDGFRMSARVQRGRAKLLTRTGLDWSDKYPSVVEALAKVGAKSAYLDGELCGIGDDGLPSFSQTQAASGGSREVRLVYSLSISYISTAATSRVCRLLNARRCWSRWSRQFPTFSSTTTRRTTASYSRARSKRSVRSEGDPESGDFDSTC